MLELDFTFAGIFKRFPLAFSRFSLQDMLPGLPSPELSFEKRVPLSYVAANSPRCAVKSKRGIVSAFVFFDDLSEIIHSSQEPCC